jgi:hypothetical protein
MFCVLASFDDKPINPENNNPTAMMHMGIIESPMMTCIGLTTAAS